MKLHVYQCPACGYNLPIEEGQTTLRCPACGSYVRIEQEENKRAGGTTFLDDATGLPIGAAVIPDGWAAHGEIQDALQSLARPLTARVQAASPDGARLLFANTGEGFHQIKAGVLEKHIEGRFDERTQTPMRTFLPPQPYLDQMAASFLGNTKLEPLDTFPLPRASIDALAEEKQRCYNEAQATFRSAQAVSGGFGIELQNVFVGGLVRAYGFTDGARARVLLLGAELKGVEYRYQMPGAALFSGLGSLLGGGGADTVKSEVGEGGLRGFIDFGMRGGLIGAKKRQAQEKPKEAPIAKEQTAQIAFGSAPAGVGASAYVDWESCGVYGMLADAPLGQNTLDIFSRFVRSFVIDPSIPARMKARGKEITDEMQRRQQQQFAAQQQAYHTRQAAFDSANQAWWNRTQQQDAARRSAYQSRMAADERMRQSYSEAVRGVNTYVRPDGSETEYSVGADRVFMRNGDPSTMRSAGFNEDVPFGWTELKRK